MSFSLKFQKPGEKGYWYTSLTSKSKEAAIEQAKEIMKNHDYKKAKVIEIICRDKTIYDFEKGEEIYLNNC